MPVETKSLEAFDTRRLLEMYSARRFELLADSLLEFLTHFQRTDYFRLTERDRRDVDALVGSFLYVLASYPKLLWTASWTSIRSSRISSRCRAIATPTHTSG